MLTTELDSVLATTVVAHLATLLPDGSPHSIPVWIDTHDGRIVIITGPTSRKARNILRDPRVAISLTPIDNPFQPVVIRGRVVEWIDGDAGWEIVDRIAQKYIGRPYARSDERVAMLIEPEHQSFG
ncbi:PPOX class F420-dependent oxidoreductase [Catenulispora subtropica]|uniref:PPOX class F420-dependent oxidoreductase n=1 Tax=Catenulispora subtropica TaxID=450798 RepID=A0ABP5CB36_9ACTN